MPSPRVTILMPFRDAAETLAECLTSIESQTLRDFELLGVDDGSTDASRRMLVAWGQRNGRLRVVDASPRGLVGALRTGLAEARSPLVARMDADDRMHPDRLSSQVAALEEDRGLDLVACRVRLFPEGEVRGGYRTYVAWQNECISEADIRDEIYWESPFAHPSVTYRRDRVVGLGGYREGPFPEDYDLWLRMVHAGCRMRKLPDVLLEWRERPERLSRVDPRYGLEAFDRLRVPFLAADPRLQQDRPLVYWGAGRATRRRSSLLAAAGHPPCAYVDVDPRKIGNRIRGVPVVPPEWLRRRPRPFVLAYVRTHGARDLIAARLRALEYERGRDYLMVG